MFEQFQLQRKQIGGQKIPVELFSLTFLILQKIFLRQEEFSMKGFVNVFIGVERYVLVLEGHF